MTLPKEFWEKHHKFNALLKALEEKKGIDMLEPLSKRIQEKDNLSKEIFKDEDPDIKLIDAYIIIEYGKERLPELRKRAEEILKETRSSSEAGTARKKKPDENTVYTSFVEGDGEIFEQVQGGSYIDAEGEVCSEINMDGINYRPIIGEELDRGIVLLPNKLKKYKDVPSLIEEIKSFITKYYDFGEQQEHLTFSAWYVLLTWIYDKLNTIPYLRALGDYGTGKTRFKNTVGLICYKPILGSGAGSVAALKRMVDKWRGTSLTDEGDVMDDDERSELIKFYNLGIEKGQSIYQCNKNNPDKIDFFDPYCPKIILTRKPFKDQALESRCLTHLARVTSRKDILTVLINSFFEEQEVLRSKLLKFRFDYYFEIDLNKVVEVDLGDIEPRLKQVMIGFASLFASMPEVLEEFRKFLQIYQKGLKEDRSSSFDGQIINIITSMIIDEGMRVITPAFIADRFDYEKKPGSRVIGRHLKILGIIAQRKKIDGKTQNAVILDENLINAVKKYVSDDERVTLVTSITSDTLSRATTQSGLKPIYKKESVEDITNVTNVTDVTSETPVTPVTLEEIEDVLDEPKGCKTEEVIDFIKKYPKCSYAAILKSVKLKEAKLDEVLHYLKELGQIWEPVSDKYEVLE